MLPMVSGEEEKVKKPVFFFLGGITEEQVKHKVFMLQEPHTVARHREFLIDSSKKQAKTVKKHSFFHLADAFFSFFKAPEFCLST